MTGLDPLSHPRVRIPAAPICHCTSEGASALPQAKRVVRDQKEYPDTCLPATEKGRVASQFAKGLKVFAQRHGLIGDIGMPCGIPAFVGRSRAGCKIAGTAVGV
jgi:hypothetical protein